MAAAVIYNSSAMPMQAMLIKLSVPQKDIKVGGLVVEKKDSSRKEMRGWNGNV